jgi:NAD(P)-dependent dehydrogenase (short-subunit alcohol dehydrogenase family)
LEPRTIAELFNLTGQVAVVTGGAQGIGHATSKRLAEAGAHVVIADVNEDAASSAAAAIQAGGGKASAITTDLLKSGEALRIIDDTIEAHGRIDILVNNAGIYPPVPVLELKEEQWDAVLTLNLKSAFFASQAAAKNMVANGREGRIVNIASMDAIFATPQLAHYSASKGGMVSMTRTMALELAPHRIRVNAIAPGSTMTEGGRKAGERFAQAYGTTVDELIAEHAAKHPFGRLADPDHIATVVLFLVSGASDNISGALLIVDGGQSLRFG